MLAIDNADNADNGWQYYTPSKSQSSPTIAHRRQPQSAPVTNPVSLSDAPICVALPPSQCCAVLSFTVLCSCPSHCCEDVVSCVWCRLIVLCGARSPSKVHPVCRPRCNAVLLFSAGCFSVQEPGFQQTGRKLILTNKTNENDNENDTGGQHVESVW